MICCQMFRFSNLRAGGISCAMEEDTARHGFRAKWRKTSVSESHVDSEDLSGESFNLEEASPGTMQICICS